MATAKRASKQVEAVNEETVVSENDEGQAENVGHLVPVTVGSQSEVGGNTYEVENIVKRGSSIFVVIFRIDDEEHNTQEVRVGSKIWTKLFPNGNIVAETKVEEKPKKKAVFVEEKEPEPEFADSEFEVERIDNYIANINSVSSETHRAILYTSREYEPNMRFALYTARYRAEMPFEFSEFERLLLVDKIKVERPENVNLGALYDLIKLPKEELLEDNYIEAIKVIPVKCQAAFFAMISENGWNIMERPKLKNDTLDVILNGYFSYPFEEEVEA